MRSYKDLKKKAKLKMDEYYIESRAYAMGLILECPFSDALTDCPLKELRELPIKERVGHFKMMSDEEIGGIIKYHKQCLKKREAGIR